MEDQPSNEKSAETIPQPLENKDGFFTGRQFRHYIFEFVLVFLAVIFGFLAESYRDYLSDRSKEEVYIEAIIRNLQDDLWQMDDIIELNRIKRMFLDTASQMRNPKSKGSDYFQTLNRVVSKGIYKNHFFKSNDAIISEMKFTGKLTLLHREVIDSLSLYERNLFEIYEEEVQYEHHSLQSIEFFLTLTEDWRYFESSMSANERELKFLINECTNVSSAVRHYNQLLANQKRMAVRLIKYLKNKYDLSDTELKRPIRNGQKYY
jgi:hypothetical protein